MDFTGTHKHYNERLRERFNIEISLEDYITTRVFKRTLNKNYVGKCVRYLFGDMVHVYYITKNFEYPITVYKLDKFNKGRIMKKPTREEIIKKWKDSGLLDGLTEMDENNEIGKLFDLNLTQKVYMKTIPNPDKNIKDIKQK